MGRGGATGDGGNTGSGGTTAEGGATGSGGDTPAAAIPDAGPDSGGSSIVCPATVMKSGDSTQNAGGRSYLLRIPTGYTGDKPLPLVLDFHALGSDAKGQRGLSHWNTKGDKEGFIAAFPESASGEALPAWNVDMCCMNAQQKKTDDVGFVREMIAAIEKIACVDPKRIYVSGCSNGGGMSYKVACDLADIVAPAAPVDFRCVYGGTTQSPSCDGCKPARPISIIHFDNTGDDGGGALVPYSGGMTGFSAACPPNQSCTGMGFPSAVEDFSTWQMIDGCTGTTVPKVGGCATNDACEGETQVTMCVQQGGGHCGNCGTLKIVDTAWDYFKNLSIP